MGRSPQIAVYDEYLESKMREVLEALVEALLTEQPQDIERFSLSWIVKWYQDHDPQQEDLERLRAERDVLSGRKRALLEALESGGGAQASSGSGAADSSTKPDDTPEVTGDAAQASSGAKLERSATKESDVGGDAPEPTEEEVEAEQAKVRAAQQRNRRRGVAAERVDQDAIKDYRKPVYEKDEETVAKIEEILKKHKNTQVLFGHLDGEPLRDVVNAFHAKDFELGTDIIRQGDDADCLYVIKEGVVDIFVARPGQHADGDKGSKVLTLSEGGLFGELALLYSAPRAATVTAASEAVAAWVLDAVDFRMLLAQSSQAQMAKYEGWLAEVDLFKVLNQYELSRLADVLVSETFKNGDLIIKQGDLGDRFFILEDGAASAYIDGDQGEKKVMEYYKIGDYFGELALLHDAPRKATVRAAGQGCSVVSLSRAEFAAMLGPISEILKERAGEYKQYADVQNRRPSAEEKAPEPPREAKEPAKPDVPTCSGSPDEPEVAVAAQPPPCRGRIRSNRKPPEQKAAKQKKKAPRKVNWSSADPEKWFHRSVEYNGGYSMAAGVSPDIVEESGSILQALERFKGDASEIRSMFYQTNMTEWPEDQQCYNVVRRGKGEIHVREEPGAGFTFVEAVYQALSPDVEIITDDFTDSMTCWGQALAKPRCPGRGQGCADVPSIGMIADVDPNDVSQGSVGDCWLLSALSALAEFSGAVKSLLRSTPGIESMPADGPNKYIVTLYDMATWEPVEVTVDERLCVAPHDNRLLGCRPGPTGDLWACYVEKAVAIHCGGWDKIQGGTCTHAWKLFTGCREQYVIRDDGDGFACFGTKNANTGEWEELANSPHDGFQGLWPMEWPACGGGGGMDLKLTQEELFERMCEWDDNNYIMCCGTREGSDSNSTDGIVDGHAYTILDCANNAGGTDFDLIKVRNPWGKGEFKSGKWDDDGPGWAEYPEVKAALQPAMTNDGIFWVNKEEFFTYFKRIYLCAKDMKDFVVM